MPYSDSYTVNNRITALIIDCHRNSNKLQSKILQDILTNFTVVIKYNIESAINEIKRNNYDAIVFNEDYTKKETEYLLKVINNQIHVPHVIFVKDKTIVSGRYRYDIKKGISYIPRNYNFEETIVAALINAKELQELIKENRDLANKLKRNNNIDISDLILSYNHEINNPLAVILGNTQLLLRKCQTEKNVYITKKLKEIEKSVSKIQKFILSLSDNISQSSSDNNYEDIKSI